MHVCYLNSHVATTTHGKLLLRLDQFLQAGRQLLARLGTEDTFRRQNLRVGPEVLRLVRVDCRVLGEDGVGQGILQGLAATGIDLARHQRQRGQKRGETHDCSCFALSRLLSNSRQSSTPDIWGVGGGWDGRKRRKRKKTNKEPRRREGGGKPEIKKQCWLEQTSLKTKPPGSVFFVISVRKACGCISTIVHPKSTWPKVKDRFISGQAEDHSGSTEQ